LLKTVVRPPRTDPVVPWFPIQTGLWQKDWLREMPIQGTGWTTLAFHYPSEKVKQNSLYQDNIYM